MLPTFSIKMGRRCAPPFVGFILLFDLLVVLDPSWPNFASILEGLEANLGPCWPHFPPKWGGRIKLPPPFCWVYVIFRFFGANPLGYPIGPCPKADGVPLLGSVFGPMWARFSKVLWSILQVLRLFFWLPFWRCLAALFQTFPAGIRWAGGVTRSAKNLLSLHTFLKQLSCVPSWLEREPTAETYSQNK